jgi:hypothetical protein
MQLVQTERADRSDDVVASGLMVEMRFQAGRKALSLRAGKMLHLLTKAVGAALCDRIVHKVPLRELRETSKVSAKEVEAIAEELTKTFIEIRVHYPKEIWSLGGILSGVELNTTDGDLMFSFSDTMIKLFSMDDRWAIISKRLVLEFESRYSLRLYEILSLRKNMRKNTEEFDLDDLRSRLGVEPGKLVMFGSFKQRVLDPAIEEINRITDINVSYELIKKNKAVRSIKLTWACRATIDADPKAEAIEGASEPAAASAPGAPKSAAKPTKAAPKPSTKAAPIEPAAAPAEPKPAPKAAQEPIEPPRARVAFPREGSIRDHHPWHEIAETHCPGYSLDLAASGFRSLAGRKQDGFALKGPDLEARFEAYCKSKAFATASARARQAALGRTAPADQDEA